MTLSPRRGTKKTHLRRAGRGCAVMVAAAGLALAAALPVRAGAVASALYVEAGGPSDSTGDLFLIVNQSDPGVLLTRLVIELAGGSAPLLFDTARHGDGQNAAAAFQALLGPIGGSWSLDPGPDVADGATSLAIDFTGFGGENVFAFLIDVDETSAAGAVDRRVVTGREFAGATFTARFEGGALESPVELSGAFAGLGPVALAHVAQAPVIAENPEPASLAVWGLGGLGVAGYGWLRRRRRQAA